MSRLPRRSLPARPGSVMILTLVILLVLTSLALMLARTMQVQARISQNSLAQAQAEAAAQGALAYVRVALANTGGALPEEDDLYVQAAPVGRAYYWLCRHDPEEDAAESFGLVDEAGKINLNSADADTLASLPDMTADLAAGILDWRDGNDNPLPGGAESPYYLMLPAPYQAKNAPFETVEELLLVKGFTPQLLYGADRNRNGLQDSADAAADASTSTALSFNTSRGLMDYLTVYSTQITSVRGRRTVRSGLVNVNTASRVVLSALGLSAAGVEEIITHRLAAGSFNSVNEAAAALTAPADRAAVNDRITTQSAQCSTEIVAVDAAGRAFKRYQVVLDFSVSPAQVLFIRDVTSLGWPLDPQILADLRAGKALPQATTGLAAAPAALTGGH